VNVSQRKYEVVSMKKYTIELCEEESAALEGIARINDIPIEKVLQKLLEGLIKAHKRMFLLLNDE